MSKQIQKNVPLAPYTSFGVGGYADNFVEVSNSEELVDILNQTTEKQISLIGYGSNTLISDQGLRGLTICLRGGSVKFDGTRVTADAGVWWDDVVMQSIENGLWGIELMSEIPGSVGAAAYINITAYGQSIGPRVQWVEVWNPLEKNIRRIGKEDLEWSYKSSIFQEPGMSDFIILQINLLLSRHKTEELTYQKAIDVAVELGLNADRLTDRRTIITETRRRAGSLWKPDGKQVGRTVGSFFRNPIVNSDQVETIISHDETGKTKEQIQNMNRVHGGSTSRVSAAHVMLAAGFKRGQQWGNVKLNDHNLLKIETTHGATASDVYNVVKLIQKTCEDKLGIRLEPEAQLLGEF